MAMTTVSAMLMVALALMALWHSAMAQEEAALWCEYLQSHPEPDVLIYNRLPKCGSTTMQKLIERTTLKNGINQWSAPASLWGDPFKSVELRTAVSKTVRRMRERNPRPTVIDGHWQQFQYTGNHFGVKNIEYIQLIRDCVSREHSLLYYALFDGIAATEAKARGVPAFIKFQKHYLATEMDVDQCLQNYECLRNSRRIDFSGSELRYLCGHNCTDVYGNQRRGAIENAHNPAAFTVIGILDELDHFLEMLECAYPTILKGIVPLYNATEKHARTGSHNQGQTDALTKILNDACQPSTNPYPVIYDDIAEMFRARYRYMKANRGRCCRAERKL